MNFEKNSESKSIWHFSFSWWEWIVLSIVKCEDRIDRSSTVDFKSMRWRKFSLRWIGRTCGNFTSCRSFQWSISLCRNQHDGSTHPSDRLDLSSAFSVQDNLSHECLSHCLDSSNMETIDDMEVQILLSKSDSFNSIYLKDLVRSLKKKSPRCVSLRLVSWIAFSWHKSPWTFEHVHRTNSLRWRSNISFHRFQHDWKRFFNDQNFNEETVR